MIHIEHIHEGKFMTPQSIMLSVFDNYYTLFYSGHKNPLVIPDDKGKWHIKYKQ